MDSLRFIAVAIRINDLLKRNNLQISIGHREKYINLTSNEGLTEDMCEDLEDFERSLSDDKRHDPCPHCGTTEMLCGHNGSGCLRIKENYGG